MTGGEAQITRLFATPLVRVTLPDFEDLNRELAALFLAKEKEGDTYRSPVHIPTQVGAVFESTFDLFSWREPPVRRLASECKRVLRDLVAAFNHYSEEEMSQFEFHYHSWFHITRYGGYQSIHYHPKACWSGIYCVRAGDKVEERPESGVVKFYDPRGAVFMHADPGNERLVPDFSATPAYLTHEEGQLAIFPSFLMHEVLPYLGKRERIVAPFNAWITRTQ
ncbi:MAG: TIGR02466 family protein [Acidiferrobacterales bacterium]